MNFSFPTYKDIKNSLFTIKDDIIRSLYLSQVSINTRDNYKSIALALTIFLIISSYFALIIGKLITLNIFGIIFNIFIGSVKMAIALAAIIAFYIYVSLYYSHVFDNRDFNICYYYVGILSILYLPLVILILNTLGRRNILKQIYRSIMVLLAFVSDYLVRKSIIGNQSVPLKTYIISTIFTLFCFILFYLVVVYRLIL